METQNETAAPEVKPPEEEKPVKDVNAGREYGNVANRFVSGITLQRYRWPVADEGQEVYTRAELAASRKPGIRDKMCKVWFSGHPGWWSRRDGRAGYFYVADKSAASAIKVMQVLSMASPDNVCYIVTLPGGRKCLFDDFIPINIANFIRQSPNNGTFRTLLASHLGQPLPPEADTYDKIKEWVEFNFPTDEEPLVGEKQKPAMPALSMPIRAVERQRGTCNFSRTMTGTVRVNLSRAELDEILLDEDGSMEDAVTAVEEKIIETVQRNVELIESEADYSDHDVSDSRGMEVEHSTGGSIRRYIGDVIRAQFPDRY